MEKVNVNVDDRGRIIVDKKFRSSTKNIFAAGDVIGFPSLAATSFEQGRLASLHMFKKNTNLIANIGKYYLLFITKTLIFDV